MANVTSVAVTCSTDTYAIGGTVSGLSGGQQVTLLDNADAAHSVTVSADGSFTFPVPVTAGASYAVTVGTQPTQQTCTVSNAAGAGVVANVTGVAVTCSTNTYAIGGTVTGLTAAQQVTLLDNADAGHALTLSANGSFTFPVPVNYGAGYSVTVGTQPTQQTCSVSNGAGTGVVADVTTVAVTCSTDTYSVSGTLSGLTAPEVTLLNNADAGHALTLSANGSFTFPVPVSYGASYAVTVGTQPTQQLCTVTNGAGASVVANITNVAVSCAISPDLTALATAVGGATSIAAETALTASAVTANTITPAQKTAIDSAYATAFLPYAIAAAQATSTSAVSNLVSAETSGITTLEIQLNSVSTVNAETALTTAAVTSGLITAAEKSTIDVDYANEFPTSLATAQTDAENDANTAGTTQIGLLITLETDVGSATTTAAEQTMTANAVAAGTITSAQATAINTAYAIGYSAGQQPGIGNAQTAAAAVVNSF